MFSGSFPPLTVTRTRRYFREAARWGLACLLVAPLLFAAGCGDDDNPADPGNGDGDSTMVGSGRATIDSLLEVFFPDAYSKRDYDRYAETLDSRYTFQRLPRDLDEPVEDLIWDLAEELAIAEAMFDGSQGPSGHSVESITLTINVGSITASDDPDEPAGEEWFEILTIIDMTIVLNDPSQSDGTGILNLLIDSEQIFVVTREGGGTGDWVIVKQEDRDRINRGVPGDGHTEEATWSDAKGLFRGVASKTEETSWGAAKDLFRF